MELKMQSLSAMRASAEVAALWHHDAQQQKIFSKIEKYC